MVLYFTPVSLPGPYVAQLQKVGAFVVLGFFLPLHFQYQCIAHSRHSIKIYLMKEGLLHHVFASLPIFH